MYDLALGVPQDYKAAVHWYTLSANQGNADAQASLDLLQRRIAVTNPPNGDPLVEFKSKCEGLGFKPKTERFGQCVLQLSR